MGKVTSKGRSRDTTDQVVRMVDLTRRAVRATSRGPRVAEAACTLGFLDWVQSNGFFADREPVNFDVWRYLNPIYRAVPADPTGLDVVIMKSAQGGASTLALLLALWLALRQRSQLAYFLPTEALAKTFSTTRFVRLVRENPEMHRLMGDQHASQRRRVAHEGSAAVRCILNSILHFTYIGGRITTEALPLDALIFDEVQEMLLSDMEKAVERISASAVRAVLRVSTANFPGADIDYYFRDSDQREFFTRCGCREGTVLSDHFDAQAGPLCIDRGNGSSPGIPREPFYICPRCNTIIKNPQDGTFRPRNPGGRRVGFHFAQTLSPRITAGDLLKKWDTRVDTRNFYNRNLGLPFADPTSMPVTQADLEAAQNHDLRWGPLPRRTADAILMGIDQMGGENYVVIKARVNGRMRLLHLEIVQAGNPWTRCAELMRTFRVTTAVVENLPNFNEAHRFSREHDGRVFIATYQTHSDDILRWGDSRDGLSIRRTLDPVRTPWTVAVDQYKMMGWSLERWARREVETPDARSLPQVIRTDRGYETKQICRDVLWLHLQRVALVTELVPGREQEHVHRSVVRKVGIDPHFAFANMLADVAWARSHESAMFLFDSHPTATTDLRSHKSPEQRQIEDAFPEFFLESSPDHKCGTCTAFARATGLCTARRLLTDASQPSCDYYDPMSDDEDED